MILQEWGTSGELSFKDAKTAIFGRLEDLDLNAPETTAPGPSQDLVLLQHVNCTVDEIVPQNDVATTIF